MPIKSFGGRLPSLEETNAVLEQLRQENPDKDVTLLQTPLSSLSSSRPTVSVGVSCFIMPSDLPKDATTKANAFGLYMLRNGLTVMKEEHTNKRVRRLCNNFEANAGRKLLQYAINLRGLFTRTSADLEYRSHGVYLVEPNSP